MLVCRLVAGKVTLVHQLLWPAVVCLADRWPPAHVAWLVETHTAAGYHRMVETPFPDWVPAGVLRQVAALSEGDAQRALGSWVPS